MLLAIDVGNTNVTIGVFDGDRLAHHWRLAALRERTADELGILITRLLEQTKVGVGDVTGIAVASVVGIGGFGGAVGGMLIATFTGFLLEKTGSYVPLFVMAGSAYLLALAAVHVLAPKLEPARLG